MEQFRHGIWFSYPTGYNVELIEWCQLYMDCNKKAIYPTFLTSMKKKTHGMFYFESFSLLERKCDARLGESFMGA